MVILIYDIQVSFLECLFYVKTYHYAFYSIKKAKKQCFYTALP